MNKAVFPVWVLFLVAAAIALAAFGLAQLAYGLGMVFVLALTTVWVGFVQARGRKAR